tara:strand:- start:130 stop:1551 length:1422 start_codon:yes stop_codon:yes gene_type:complete
MLNKLRGFSNTKLAGVLIAIIIIPFVFWGMGSVFSGGNTNNIAKVNNEIISTQDFMKYVNQSMLDSDYIKKNINNNVIENIISTIVSKKLLDMEINDLNILLPDKSLAEKIKSNEVFLDDKKNFSRIKYERFLLENNLTAPDFEIRFKEEELKKKLFYYVGGGIRPPHFLNNKMYINQTKDINIDYINLDNVYNTETTQLEIDNFIKDNEENLKEEFIDISYAKITPSNLIEIDEFNDEFFKKIDEIENSILNGSSIENIKKKYNLNFENINSYNGDQDENKILKEIYQKRNEDKIQLLDKNDYFLIFEISKINKILPSKSNLNFISRVKENLVLKKKYEFNKELFEKIQDKKLDNDEFLKLSNGNQNLKNITINSLVDDEVFDKESLKLIYSLPEKSFVLITNTKNSIFVARINNIYNKNLLNDDEKYAEYTTKSRNKIVDEIYSSYDLALNNKYKVKVFQNTLERIKNNFK